MFFGLRRTLPVSLFFFALIVNAGAQSPGITHIASEADFANETSSLFPQALFNSYLEARNLRDAARPYWAASEAELHVLPFSSPWESILLNNDILAFYGHPRSKNMGILGRYTKEELNKMLGALAAEYREAGGRNVCKALYIIFGTVWPGGEIGIIQDSLLKEYIEFALENDMLVFIDHQIGRFTPADSIRRMLPWLKYTNVHLALDPEWRTAKPMEEIGTVSADEINQVQRIIEDYMTENRIPGERLLIIHQFNYLMISEREKVSSNFPKVTLVHCADGFGSPQEKRSSYAHNARAANIPVKAFKLFYNFNIPGAGFDDPLLTPREVFALKPRPYIVMYQ
jgi:hypothetical protein